MLSILEHHKAVRVLFRSAPARGLPSSIHSLHVISDVLHPASCVSSAFFFTGSGSMQDLLWLQRCSLLSALMLRCHCILNQLA